MNQEFSDQDSYISDEKLRVGYWQILTNTVGYVSNLEKICNGLAKYFSSIGLICYGINDKGDTRYTTTTDGVDLAKVMYSSLTEKLINDIL